MSSSYVVEPQESETKKDDTLIIVVNDDGTISVDQQTLQNLMMNQSNANVSVVRLGQAEGDAENGDITLTVDPPSYVPPGPAATAATTGTTDAGVAGLVDPFMEMDPEQLERLETALQSEEAKQILGENVTAMLDMLSVEEEQNCLKHSIQLDHCYTSRKSPTDPRPSDPLPLAESPDIIDTYASSTSTTTGSIATYSAKGKNVKAGRGAGRPRLRQAQGGVTTGTPKTTGNPVPKNVLNALQQGTNKGALVPLIKPLNMNDIRIMSGTSDDAVEDEPMSSTTSESSESEPPSDDDSDFGPRGPRRGGVRARGGRKGLTTRGGSMTATRRRATSNKQMDMEQVRRLDMEMAAAVDAMKSPDKEDKVDKFSPVNKTKRQLKTMGGKKKEESVPAPTSTPAPPETPPVYEKPLQTTNQVKANLINANMIKGDMILTKPGQMKNNQKVIFVQKQVMMKASELKNLSIKKQQPIVASKPNLTNQMTTKVTTVKDAKLLTPPMTSKAVTQPTQAIPPPKVAAAQVTAVPSQIPKVVQQQATSVVLPKAKTPEIKKEKKKIEILPEAPPKVELEPIKPVEPRTPDGKKQPKREHRKSPAHLADALGPALFSTPDIIRRVGSGSEPKTPETPTTPLTPIASTSTAISSSVSTPVSTSVTTPVIPATITCLRPVTPIATAPAVTFIAETPIVAPVAEATPIATAAPATPIATTVTSVEPTATGVLVSSIATTSSAIPVHPVLESKIHSIGTLDEALQPELQSRLPVDNPPEMQEEDEEQKIDLKVPLADELQPSLDPALNPGPPDAVSTPVEPPIVPDHNVSETSGIEGEEHLLATLEMEASKHEEELLAEALLLQEELGVDLADHAGLDDQTPAAPEPLLPAAPFVPVATSVLQPPAQTIVPSLTSPLSAILEQNKKGTREEKEPIQIVRGGRVITLPPIEAPATRSKRLQAKTDVPTKKIEVLKKNDKVVKQVGQQPQPTQQPTPQPLFKKEEMDSDMDEDDDEDGNSDSEDDPDRLWCICKRPHNNRFMICCDVCEDWFHGKCVHVSKAMGQQMEEKGIEWVCPNCTKKKAEEARMKSPASIKVQKTLDQFMQPVAKPREPSPVQEASNTIPVQPAAVSSTPAALVPIATPLPGVTQCVVCKKEARNSSIYCSDACILTHAQESLTKDKPPAASPPPPPPPTPPLAQAKGVKIIQDAPKTKPDARVIVFERKTGKVLTGTEAPTTSNLKTWLKENPTFEVVRPNNLNTLQIGGKTVTAIQTQGVGKINKTGQQIAGKVQPQAKMVYTKVVGSKQTVLAASNKKLVIVSGGQQQQSNASPHAKTIQSRQMLLTPSPKNATILTRQILPKASPQQQSKLQTATTLKQTQVKKLEVKPSTSQQKILVKSPFTKRPDTEPIRLNIRKTLAELLSSRIKETDDLNLTEDEITALALNIELEMYKFFKDTGAKYKAKYRSLVFNIKDTKNLTLFRKIAEKSLAPEAVVRLSPDEMASQELAEWREKEAKHQLEMIKKNELDLMAQAKSIVVKTHKGEQIIENDDSTDHVDPQTPVQDIVTALNSGEGITSTVEDDKEKEKEDKTKVKDEPKKSGTKTVDDKKKKDKDKEKERGREKDKERDKDKHDDRSRSRSRRHRSRERERSKTRERSRERRSTRSKDIKRDKDRDREREREREREKDRDKERQKDKDKYKGSRSSTRNQSRARHRDYKEKEKEKIEEERKKEVEMKKEPTPPPAEKPIEDRLWRHIEEETTTNTLDGNDSDVSDREPSSTVNIKTPDINEDPEKEKEHVPEKEPVKGALQTVWRGFVNMVDVAKFFITAQEVSGHARDLMDDLPDTVDVVGRISHETVWDYISKMKKTGSKEILVIRLTAANDEEKIPYITLYSYLNSRSRLGVVGNVSKNIKDFYIMPFSSQSQIPQVLLPLDGPGFEEHRPHLLLGIIVRNKRKRPSIAPVVVPAKVAKKEPDRSYTPPIVDIPKDKLSTSSPPLSPKPHSKPLTLDSLKEKQQSITQTILDTLNKAHVGMSRSAIENVKLSKIVPELTSKIGLNPSQKLLQKESSLDDDGDEPYSPGGMDDELPDSLPKRLLDSAMNALSPNKNSTELQRKMDELNRQIEEQKQQIQSISSSFLGDATTTLPGLGLDPPRNDLDEAYSPSDSRSFTPPPPGITKLSQPLLDKVSNITIPANLQEILANVKRQESSKVDPYLPSKPSATFLTSVNSSAYQKTEKYSPLYPKITGTSMHGSEKAFFETQHNLAKDNKSTLRSLSDLDLIKKAEEELAAVAAASPVPSLARAPPPVPTMVPPPVPNVTPPPAVSLPPIPTMVPPPVGFPSVTEPGDTKASVQLQPMDNLKMSFLHDQPKPPGLEDEEFPIFPLTTPPPSDNSSKSTSPAKFLPKSGIVLSVKRKMGDESSSSPSKTPRTKSRWGQGPSPE